MAECKIIKCNCQSEFQDNLYGKNLRVMNPIGKNQDSGYKCTVCGKEVSKGSDTKKK